MIKHSIHIGLDVHKDTIAVAIARGQKEPESLGIIPNNPESITKLMRRYGPYDQLRVCYEAGPCGYVIYRQLHHMGIDCLVAAPSLIPRKPGDRVKTDRRDALKLAHTLRNGDLTPVWVPSASHEALRDLSRACYQSRKDRSRVRHRISKLLLRQGVYRPAHTNTWTLAHRDWLNTIHFPFRSQDIVFREMLHQLDQSNERVERLTKELAQEAEDGAFAPLIAAWQCMRGIAVITSVGLAAEFGDVRRFDTPRQMMSYVGLVPAEHSSGSVQRRGSITKTGNNYLRHILVESAWHYRHAPAISAPLRKRQKGQPERVREIAWQAQQRLNRRFWRLVGRGKLHQKAVVAVAREMLGFIWAIAHEVPVVCE